MNMQKMNRFFENFWLVFVVMTFFYACYETSRLGFADGGRNFVIPVLAFLWWYMRRMMRKRLEKHEDFRK